MIEIAERAAENCAGWDSDTLFNRLQGKQSNRNGSISLGQSIARLHRAAKRAETLRNARLKPGDLV